MRGTGDSVEFVDLAGSVGLLALHGGRIEPGTEEIARFVAGRAGASLYVYSGRRPAGNRALHRPSHRTVPSRRPLLQQFLAHVATLISLHGHGRRQSHVYVGGLNTNMARGFVELVRPVLPRYAWICEPERIPPGMRGIDPRNVVNLPPGRGMQLELPRGLRQSRRAPGKTDLEPSGDALVLSRLLVQFVGRVMHTVC
jgi:phage replication-related protein YjqB (UPF0714/DUF867 family)